MPRRLFRDQTGFSLSAPRIALSRSPDDVGTAVSAIDLGQRLVTPPCQDWCRHGGDPCRRELRLSVLLQVASHHLRDEEFGGRIRATGRSVDARKVRFKGRFSRCTIICACACANLFRSVEDDPDGASVVATGSEIESGWESSAGHCGLVKVELTNMAFKDSGVTKCLPAMMVSWSLP